MRSQLSNVEAAVVQTWLQESSVCWKAIALTFLQQYRRDIAIQKLSEALRLMLRETGTSRDSSPGRLRPAGIARLGYEQLALQIVLSSERTERAWRLEMEERMLEARP